MKVAGNVAAGVPAKAAPGYDKHSLKPRRRRHAPKAPIWAHNILMDRVPYRALGQNYFDERDKQAVERPLVRRLEQLVLNAPGAA